MTKRDPRVTLQGFKVLGAFARNPRHEFSGADIARETSLLSGTLYPILIRFESCGWLKSTWEDGDPVDLGRPKRRLYRLTAAGQLAYQEQASELIPGGLAWT